MAAQNPDQAAAWLEQSQVAEDALLEVLGDLGAGQPSAARAQALVRYVAVQQLHVAIAAEIAWVDPPAGLQRVLGEVAFGPDGLAGAMISDDPSGTGAGPGSPVDEAVEAIVDQAKDATLAIGCSLPHNLPTHALTLVRHVARLAPHQIDRHLGRVARKIRACIGWLLKRGRQALDRVPQWIADYAQKIAELLELRDRIAHAALAGMLGANGVKRQANRDFDLQAAQPHRKRRARELRDLVESNKRWVGPVETIAPATGVLWGIPVVGPRLGRCDCRHRPAGLDARHLRRPARLVPAGRPLARRDPHRRGQALRRQRVCRLQRKLHT